MWRSCISHPCSAAVLHAGGRPHRLDDAVAAAVGRAPAEASRPSRPPDATRETALPAGCTLAAVVRSLRSSAVKAAASRLAALGPVGPPLTAAPLRLDGNEVR
jgi:hypothetical protein